MRKVEEGLRLKQVELVGLSKSFDGIHKVINNIDVKVDPGEFFVLVGPSGCGKSTMLRMIAGLEDVSGGEIWIGEINATKLQPNQRNLSMVFQNYALYPHLTVEENITFGLHTKKISKQEQKKRSVEAAKMLGLSELMKRKPRQLSGGQRQRVALARAIVTHTPICLMDEPLSNLDAKLRARMRSEIRQLQRKLGITMIYVTHDQTEAMTMADRMMILNEGEVQQVGRPLEIYNHPTNTFVASFIGAPPMNLINGTLSESKILINEEMSIQINSEITKVPMNNKVTVGVRPEKLQPGQEDKNTFFVNVVNVEVLGDETLLTFDIGQGEQWISKWNGQWDIKVGEQVPIFIEEDDIFLFDIENGECISNVVEDQSILMRSKEVKE